MLGFTTVACRRFDDGKSVGEARAKLAVLPEAVVSWTACRPQAEPGQGEWH